jgi:hypothetical protein
MMGMVKDKPFACRHDCCSSITPSHVSQTRCSHPAFWVVEMTMTETEDRNCNLSAGVLSGKTPLDRAKYFALRESLARDWQPRNGMEDALLEQFAMYLMRTLEWQYILPK